MRQLKKFLEAQETIYQKFRAARETVLRDGIVPDPAVTDRKGGMHIVLRHTEPIARSLAQLANMIAVHVPAVAYGEDAVHTSISDHGVSVDRIVAPNDEDLLTIIRAVKSASNFPACQQASKAARVKFREVLVNQTTAIVAGIPNQAFVDATNLIVLTANLVMTDCLGSHITLREPWGAHTTLNRFMLQQDANDDTRDLVEYLDGIKTMMTTSNPVCFSAVDIATSTCGPEGFALTVMKHIPIA